MNYPGFIHGPGDPTPGQFPLSTPFFPPRPPGGPPGPLREAASSSISWSPGPSELSPDPRPLENLLGTESDWSKQCTQDAHGQAGLDSLKPFHHDLPWGQGGDEMAGEQGPGREASGVHEGKLVLPGVSRV